MGIDTAMNEGKRWYRSRYDLVGDAKVASLPAAQASTAQRGDVPA